MTKEPASPAATPPVGLRTTTAKSAKTDRPPTSSSTSPAAVRRSVWGCLTCRRRKVKCQSRDTPCAACKRLQLECVPSFGGNIKQWRRQRMSTSTTEGPTRPSIGSPSLSTRPPALQPTAQRSPLPASESLPAHTSQYDPDPPSLHAFLAMTQSPGWDPGWDLEMPLLFGSAPPLTTPLAGPPPFSPDLYAPPSLFTEDAVLPVDMDGRLAMTSSPQTGDGFVLSELDMPVSLSGASPAWSTHSPTHFFASPRMLPPPTPCLPAYTDSPADRSLVVYYKRNLASFFSVKSAFASPAASPWNFYAYAIRAAEHQPDSPLRHSILAWTSAYLLVKGDAFQSGADMDHALQVRHYARARQAADALREELQGDGKGYSTAVALPTTSASTSALRMLLATTLFLAYGDILSGDTARLVASLGGIARLLASDWPRFRAAIGPVEARILVWLAYLDLRAGLWTSPATNSLFRFLRDHVGGSASSSGIAALRGNGGPQQYYLAACFGSQLPAHELHDDLLQEPAKRLSDEIMGVFAAVADLEGWMEQVFRRGAAESAAVTSNGSVVPVNTFGAETDTDILDLRAAKILAIRATIARIRAESKVVHAALLKAYTPSSPDHVARTTFHRRVSTAMCLAATILLNRVDAPDVRTDDEAQAAARDIVQIARELRTDPPSSTTSTATASPSYAHPKSLIWPMPVFVAGIEVTDPVYQDWVLAYLGDMAGWGTSTRRAKELLRRVLERQDKEGKRVRVKDVIGEFGAVLI